MFLARHVDLILKRQGDSLYYSIYEFLLDLLLDWEDIPSYEQYVVETSEEIDHRTGFAGYLGGISMVDTSWMKDFNMLGNTSGKRNYEVWRDAAVSAVLVASPVPTIPSWLIDLAERIDESQDEYY